MNVKTVAIVASEIGMLLIGCALGSEITERRYRKAAKEVRDKLQAILDDVRARRDAEITEEGSH